MPALRTAGDAVAEDDPDPWLAVEELAHRIDRQLECMRSIVASGDQALSSGPLGQHVRRSATEVADRAASLAAYPGGPAETARCLAAAGALAAWAVELSSQAPGQPPDVVVVLGDAVTDRYRSLVQWAIRREPRVPATDIDLALELYLRQLADPAAPSVPSAPEVWRLAAIWVAIAAKVGEAAAWWGCVEPAARPRVPLGAE